MTQELQTEREIFTRTWQMLKAFRNMDATQWGEALEAARNVYAAADADPAAALLAKALALAVLDYLEKRQEG